MIKVIEPGQFGRIDVTRLFEARRCVSLGPTKGPDK
jgi:hypothetical protein